MLRPTHLIKFCAVLLALIVAAAAGMADTSQSPPMSMAPASSVNRAASDALDDIISTRLGLSSFEVAVGDISSCPDARCSEDVKSLASIQCAVDACNGKGGTKGPIACFGDNSITSLQEKEQVSAAFCTMLKSPSDETRKALRDDLARDLQDDDVAPMEALSLAFNGSPSQCESTIKSYVGKYGPSWSFKWYRIMSGCRIIGHQRTRAQEESDFETWYGAIHGQGKCKDIMNAEMRDACSAPKAAPPIPPFGKPQVHA